MQLTPVIARPEAYFCVSLLPAILGSNPVLCMDVCHL